MLRLLTDENFDYDLVRGVLRRRPTVDFIRVQSIGLAAADDPEILAWAANEQLVVLTHDVNTMTRNALERIRSGELMAELFLVHQERAAPLAVIEDLLLLDDCSETAEWASQILYLPLG